ncbi:MAG: Hsp70 family protein [Myxococcota bacterium]
MTDLEAERPLYVGFDLGTTNSAAAVFDGESVHSVRAAQGGFLTPSVVRLSKKGTVSVGAKARRFLESDPENTRAEFKRLMGTPARLSFASAGVERSPVELSAEVLKTLCADVETQFGRAPTRAVITVPALFELPQSADTTRAAELAGLTQVELLQEPVASALAAGWSAEIPGSWLVYDLGGGTFDVSLLETRDGLLRVVGHDGDNFLGGRDFDRAVTAWAAQQLEQTHGLSLKADNPEHVPWLRRLSAAAEDTRVELSRSQLATLALAEPIELEDEEFEVELELNRPTLEKLIEPLIDRTVRVCHRLLDEHGLQTGDIARVVLVGGPTATPSLIAKCEEALAPIARGDLDPMTLVSRGAALYGATVGLDDRASKRDMSVSKTTGATRLWLHYPPVSSDLEPHVIGRIVESASRSATSVALKRADGGFKSEATPVDEEGGFVASVVLKAQESNVFELELRDAKGAVVSAQPTEITIIHGVTLSDPPLSRTVGVALADGRVRVYLERGTPLPAKRTFVHRLVDAISPGRQSVVKIPIVQGEYERARLCRLVGELEVPGRSLKRALPSGSSVEVTIELDRGGRLVSRALIPHTEQVFEGVAHLLVPASSPTVLADEIVRLSDWLGRMQGDAFRNHDTTHVEALDRLRHRIEQTHPDIAALQGGDEDAGQRARRTLLDVESELMEVEAQRSWPELEEEIEDEITSALGWVGEYGTGAEKAQLEHAVAAAQRALERRSVSDAQRRLNMLRTLRITSYFRSPDAWPDEFEHARSRIDLANDLPAAQRLIQQGETHLESGDTAKLKLVVHQLWDLLPPGERERRDTHGSGVR